LEEALAEIAAQRDRAAYLKVMIPAEESVGLPDNVIGHQQQQAQPKVPPFQPQRRPGTSSKPM
jgi:hypothetical protein